MPLPMAPPPLLGGRGNARAGKMPRILPVRPPRGTGAPLCRALAASRIISGFRPPCEAAVDKILIRGARTHNLKNVDLTLPRDKLIVITGLSGSGKSSWLSTRSMRKASGATWNPSRPTPGSSCR